MKNNVIVFIFLICIFDMNFAMHSSFVERPAFEYKPQFRTTSSGQEYQDHNQSKFSPKMTSFLSPSMPQQLQPKVTYYAGKVTAEGHPVIDVDGFRKVDYSKIAIKDIRGRRVLIDTPQFDNSKESSVEVKTPEFQESYQTTSNFLYNMLFPKGFQIPGSVERGDLKLSEEQLDRSVSPTTVTAVEEINNGLLLDQQVDTKSDNVQVKAEEKSQAMIFEEQIKSQYPNLPDADVQKMVKLIHAIKDSNVVEPRQLMMPVAENYKNLKIELYPEGLPEGVAPKDLFEISKKSNDGGNNSGPVLDMSAVQKGTTLGAPVVEAVEKSYIFDSVSAMMKEQSKVEKTARGVVEQNIKNNIQERFLIELPVLQEAFRLEFADHVDDPSFDQKMQEHMNEALKEKINKAYDNNSAIIDRAGKKAVEEFKILVYQAAKKGMSKEKSSMSKEQRAENTALAKIKTDVYKAQIAFINQRIEDAFSTIGIDVKDDQTNQISKITKSQWIKKYRFNNAGKSVEQMNSEMNEFLTKQKQEASQLPENKRAIMDAQRDAVYLWRANKKL